MSYSEIYIEVGNVNDDSGFLQFKIPKIALSATEKFYTQSSIWGAMSNTSQRARVAVTNTYVRFAQYGVNANETYNGITMRVYCK